MPYQAQTVKEPYHAVVVDQDSFVIPTQRCAELMNAWERDTAHLARARIRIMNLEAERDEQERTIGALLEACKGALAALTQPATYPADIEAARAFLRAAIDAAEGEK